MQQAIKGNNEKCGWRGAGDSLSAFFVSVGKWGAGQDSAAKAAETLPAISRMRSGSGSEIL